MRLTGIWKRAHNPPTTPENEADKAKLRGHVLDMYERLRMLEVLMKVTTRKIEKPS